MDSQDADIIGVIKSGRVSIAVFTLFSSVAVQVERLESHIEHDEKSLPEPCLSGLAKDCQYPMMSNCCKVGRSLY
jgi:hypothetical protein